jgi:hypothetical protein
VIDNPARDALSLNHRFYLARPILNGSQFEFQQNALSLKRGQGVFALGITV